MPPRDRGRLLLWITPLDYSFGLLLWITPLDYSFGLLLWITPLGVPLARLSASEKSPCCSRGPEWAHSGIASCFILRTCSLYAHLRSFASPSFRAQREGSNPCSRVQIKWACLCVPFPAPFGPRRSAIHRLYS